MKINFDNFRTKAARTMDDLIKLYNDRLLTAPKEYADHAEETLADLSSFIGSLLCIYDERVEDFSDLSHIEIREIRSYRGDKEGVK